MLVSDAGRHLEGRASLARLTQRAAAVSAYTWGVLFATAAGLVLRVFMLGYMPLWRDEAFTGVVARLPLGSMLNAIAHDSGPPLHYMAVKALFMFTSSPVAVRIPSVVAGTAIIPIAAALGRRAAGDRGGVLAAFCVAVLPYAVFEAREGRMYAAATFFGLAACLALWRGVEQPGWGRWGLYAGLVALGAYTQYLVALAVVSLVVAAAVALRPSRGAIVGALLATGAGLLTLLPWLVFAQPQFHHASDAFWVHALSLPGVVNTLMQVFGGPTPPRWLALKDLRLVIGLVALAIAGLLLARAWLSLNQEQRRGTAYLFIAGAFGVAALAAISLRRPLFESRYAGVLWPPLYPLMGVSLSRVAWRPLAAVVVALVAGLVPPAMLIGNTPDYVAVAAQLNETVEPADTIALLTPKHYFPLVFYSEPDTGARVVIFDRKPPWYWGLAAIEPSRITGRPVDSQGRIFAVVDPGRPDPPLAAGFKLAGHRCYSGICVDTFRHDRRSARRLNAGRPARTGSRPAAGRRPTG